MVDDTLCHGADAKTIGSILCQDRNQVMTEFTLRGTNKTIGVSEFKLTRALPARIQSCLPTIEAELAVPSFEKPPPPIRVPERRREPSMSRWPMVSLSEVLKLQRRWIKLQPTETYQEIGIRSFGNGIFHKPPIQGSTLGDKRVLRIEPGDLVLNNVFAWEGAVAVAGQSEAGKIGSHRFITYTVDPHRATPEYLKLFFTTDEGLGILLRASPGSAGRNKTLGLDRFIANNIPLPPVEEQRRLVARINELADKVATAQDTMRDIQGQTHRLLMSSYTRLTKGEARQRLGDIAPLVRRPVSIDPFGEYPQVSVRSFGRGPFHNPPLKGSDLTWEKPHLVKAGDILISNIKAWEGAIAVARPEDDERYGSHRYLTFVPVPGVITARFLCFHLLSQEGLHHVGEASPGSADRNRTTSSRGLLEIPVPVPGYERQLWFGKLYDKVEALRELQNATSALREVLMPSFIDKALKGNLELGSPTPG